MRTWPALEVGPLQHPDLFQAALLDYDVSAIDETTQPDALAGVLRQRRRPHRRGGAALTPVSGDVHTRPRCAGRRLGHEIAGKPARGDNWQHHRGASLGRPGRAAGHRHSTVDGLRYRASCNNQVVPRGAAAHRRSGSPRHGRRHRLGASGHCGQSFRRRHVDAIDEDADALRAADDNVLLNPGANVTAASRRRASRAPDSFDVVVANLTGALLCTPPRRFAS